MPKKPREIVKCAVCGHVGPGRVPKGGDGSELRPHPHMQKNKGVFAEACPGIHYGAQPLDGARP